MLLIDFPIVLELNIFGTKKESQIKSIRLLLSEEEIKKSAAHDEQRSSGTC